MKSDENSLYNKENQKKNHLNNCIILDWKVLDELCNWEWNSKENSVDFKNDFVDVYVEY